MTERTGRARHLSWLACGVLLAGTGLAGLAPGTASASSHREAPGITDTPKVDNTDVYAFVSPDKANSVTLIANWIPFEEPAGGPNFYPWETGARYEIHVDNNGDAKADITYRWRFRNVRAPRPSDSFTGLGTFLYNNGPVTSLTDPNLLFRQQYTLKVITHGKTRTLTRYGRVAPSNVGKASMPAYESLRDAAIQRAGGVKTFAGQAEDPFFLDLRLFDLLFGDQGTCNKEIGHDTLNGYNVNTIALKVPTRMLRTKSDPVIGVWSTTSRLNGDGHMVQVSRLGQPLVNELVIPYQLKDAFNSIDPTKDAVALPYVLKPELASLLKNVCGVNAATRNRQDLVTIFLTGIKGLNQPKNVTPSEQLRLNTSIPPTRYPKRLGVLAGDLAGFPNGRRLADDVVDIELQAAGGLLAGTLGPNSGNRDNKAAGALGDAVDRNASGFGRDFPYVGLPHSGSVPQYSPPARHGETLLTGGDGRSPSGGQPTGALLALGLGLLAIVAGAVGSRRARDGVAPATA